MNEARKQWFAKRVEQIHASVTIYDVLRHNGVDLKQISDATQEQISCPFHGADAKPSARVYPGDGGDEKGHVWCFVCQEPHWDAIGLWRKFNGGKENCSFGQALSGLERQFGIQPPEAPTGAWQDEEAASVQADIDKNLESFKKLYLSCEKRLLACRVAYKYMEDMQGFLAAGSALDKIRFRVDAKLWPPEKGVVSLHALLEKISEKVRKCPVG